MLTHAITIVTIIVIVITLPWQTWLLHEDCPNQCTLAHNLLTKCWMHSFVFTSKYSFYEVTALDQPVILLLNSGRRMLQNKLFTNRKLRRIWSSRPQSIHAWKVLLVKAMFPSLPTHHPSKLCKAFMKAQEHTDKMAHLRSKLTSRQTLLPSRKDLAWPHCHLQTDIQTGTEEGSPHFQKLSYTVKN